MQHGKVSREMFPEYKIDSITNGVHAPTWLSAPFQELLDAQIPSWRRDNLYLRNAIDLPEKEILDAHARAKEALLGEVATRTGHVLNPNVLTLGFARRVATYKRASLLFTDPERLLEIARGRRPADSLRRQGPPAGQPRQGAHSRRHRDGAQASPTNPLRIVYLENYAWELGALLTAGVDVWVNTPRRPYEASGTSGMKAALNGVPSLSILDGWWIEGCIEGVTGWAIEDGADDAEEADSLYDKLENAIVPLYRDTSEVGAPHAQHARLQRLLLQHPPHGLRSTCATPTSPSAWPSPSRSKKPPTPTDRRQAVHSLRSAASRLST